jgi:hypothetical protein
VLREERGEGMTEMQPTGGTGGKAGGHEQAQKKRSCVERLRLEMGIEITGALP